jgi:hypothetical protein
LIWRPILHGGNWMLFVAVVMVSSVAALLLFPTRATIVGRY